MPPILPSSHFRCVVNKKVPFIFLFFVTGEHRMGAGVWGGDGGCSPGEGRSMPGVQGPAAVDRRQGAGARPAGVLVGVGHARTGPKPDGPRTGEGPGLPPGVHQQHLLPRWGEGGG